MRLNKFLAGVGVASRRQADQMILDGRISVNGVKADIGVQIEPDRDVVMLDGNVVRLQTVMVYYLMNKPAGYLTTVTDPFERKTVMELLPTDIPRVFPVGRLDLETSGLLLFTNDGDLTLALTHPRHLVEKTYLANIKGTPTEAQLEMLRNGVELTDGMTAPAKVEIVGTRNNNPIIKISIREGRKRQVRRMMLAIEHPVLALERISVGSLSLGDLPLGEVRQLSENELQELLQLKQVLK